LIKGAFHAQIVIEQGGRERSNMEQQMITRRAACSCGQLQLTCEGDPVRVSMCHCLECQRRTGGIFGNQARFEVQQIKQISGSSTTFVRRADSGGLVTFRFCPVCGSTVYWEAESFPGLIAVAIGAFADPGFPAPNHSVFERRRHHWVEALGGDTMQRSN
jgi:hypothetical protein